MSSVVRSKRLAVRVCPVSPCLFTAAGHGSLKGGFLYSGSSPQVAMILFYVYEKILMRCRRHDGSFTLLKELNNVLSFMICSDVLFGCSEISLIHPSVFGWNNIKLWKST